MRADTPIPAQMRHLPRDPRGLPITYTSIIMPDGTYDFTQADMLKWHECVRGRQCAICGKPLPKKMWFIGGPLAMTNRFFFDLGMHEECARYALVVCPYLAVRSYTKAKKRNVTQGVIQKELTSSSSKKPAVFGLAQTDGYVPVTFQGDDLVRAKRWMRDVEWWDAGQRVEFDYTAYLKTLIKVEQ